MRKDVNFILFGLLLLSLVSMIALTLYYKSVYQGLSARYADAQTDIDKKASELNETITLVNAKEDLLNKKEKILLDYINELNLSKNRELSLGEHFTALQGEKEELQEDLNITRGENKRLESAYTEAKKDLDVCDVNYQLKTKELTDVSNQLVAAESALLNMGTHVDDVDDSRVSMRKKVLAAKNVTKEMDDKIDDVTNSALKTDLQSDMSELKGELNDLEGLVDELEDIVYKMKKLLE